MTQRYKIGPRPQLVDLNRELINFRLTFQCKSLLPDKKFYACATTQKKIDEQGIEALEYKEVESSISGSITANDNAHHNYFLVLRSPETLEVEVTIEVEPLKQQISLQHATPPPPTPAAPSPSSSTGEGDDGIYSFFTSRYFLIALLVLVFGFFVYSLFFSKPPVGSTPPSAASVEASSSARETSFDVLSSIQ